MFYLEINDKIRELINMVPEEHFGCRSYCKYKLIAKDELEVLRRMIEKKGRIINQEEFKGILKSTKSHYFHTTHFCEVPESMKEKIKREEEKEELDSIINLKGDKIATKKENIFFNAEKFEQDYKIRMKQKAENDKIFNKPNRKQPSYSSMSSGISMLVSFFLIVFGSYYFGKNLLNLSNEATFKLVLVITIVVFLSETCLLMLRLHKDQINNPENIKYMKDSFAYRFNKNYRQKIINDNTYKGKTKAKTE